MAPGGRIAKGHGRTLVLLVLLLSQAAALGSCSELHSIPIPKGSDDPQLCICSSKSPERECQCTDISVLDGLLANEVFGSSFSTQGAGSLQEKHNETDTIVPRAVNCKRVFHEHLSSREETAPAKPAQPTSKKEVILEVERTTSSAEVETTAIISLSAQNAGSKETFAIATQSKSEKVPNSWAAMSWERMRTTFKALLPRLLLSMWLFLIPVVVYVAMISVRDMRTAGSTPPTSSGECLCCQHRKAELEVYARKRLERTPDVIPRQARSDVGPRIPPFDSDDEEEDPSYLPTTTEESSAGWESDESSGESCEMLL